MLDREGIKAIIPHRDPFLLVDRIEEFTPGESAVGYLDVHEDMFWVPGHFPDYAVMPGVLSSRRSRRWARSPCCHCQRIRASWRSSQASTRSGSSGRCCQARR